jgi:hypothetical protein
MYNDFCPQPLDKQVGLDFNTEYLRFDLYPIQEID